MGTQKIPEHIMQLARSYRAMLERDSIPVESMIVFGSQAKGRAHANSDIDVCVVSPSFGKNDLHDMQMLFRKARRIDSRIEPYPMTPLNMKDTSNPIVREILGWGVVV